MERFPGREEKQRLLMAYRSATRLYSLAVNQLQKLRATASREEYEDVKRFSDDARAQCWLAKEELEAHIAFHDC